MVQACDPLRAASDAARLLVIDVDTLGASGPQLCFLRLRVLFARTHSGVSHHVSYGEIGSRSGFGWSGFRRVFRSLVARRVAVLSMSILRSTGKDR